MTDLTLRSVKGSPLTHNEVDGNFTSLNTDKLEDGDTVASLTLTTANINGGTIDGTVIGGTAAAAGSFTNVTVSGTVDGRDVAADGTKLDTVETNADVTDTASVTAAGALMDSELASIASIKALNQGVSTTDSPTFANVTATTDITTATVSIGLWEIKLDGSDLRFTYNGTDRMRLTTAGALIVGDDVTAFGSP